jgi:hypothetical protein
MKKIMFSFLSVSFALGLSGAKIDRMVVRQQWPWKDNIKIEYRIKDVTEKTDVGVVAYKGDERLTLDSNAITGKRFLIDKEGIYTIEIDAKNLFDSNNLSGKENIRFDLIPESSSSASKEVFYKIFDFETKTVTDVTRGALLNGEFGAYEVDYAKIGEGFSTPLKDVLIWTGVTNYPGAKTTKLVMRRIPAGVGYYHHVMDWGKPIRTLTTTQPFYIGVFELTQKQYSYFGSFSITSDYCLPHKYSYNIGDNKPMQNFGVSRVMYGGTERVWTMRNGCSLDKLNKYFQDAGSYNFHLPTQCMWYRAAFAESKTYYYDGIAGAPENFDYNERMAKLGQFAGNGGLTYNDDGSVVSNGVVEVGLYKPNAFGLYDVLGNVYEATHDNGRKLQIDLVDSLGDLDSNGMGVFGNSYAQNAQLWPQSKDRTNLHSIVMHSDIGVRLAFFEDVNPYVTTTTE